MTTPNTTLPLPFWKQSDGEERQLRVFISHRYGDDKPFYDGVITALNRAGFSVQDMSLTEDKQKKGPRGGRLPDLTIQAEIAARIYTSDVFIAPSAVAVAWSPWLTWEVQTATIGYGVPALFVNKLGQKKKAQLVTDVAKLGLPCRVCERETRQIVSSVAELVTTRPTWAVRLRETDPNLRFRGPPDAVLTAIMAQTPYLARLPDPEPELDLNATKKKRGFLGLLGLGR